MKSKKKFVAVVGERNFGKSTIIRALTGVKGSIHPERVKDLSTQKWIGVISHSPEEQGISAARLKKEIRAAALNTKSLGMVIALQPNNPTKRLSIEDVFQMTQRYGFERHVFVITKPYRGSRVSDLKNISTRLSPFSVQMPIQQLSAKRFAHVNASAIRDIVGWF